ncbi:MAG: HEPN domain-containing protein [bacterium]
MNSRREALDFWLRAVQTLRTAKGIKDDNNSVANRCYYAAFHAVSALFALDGKTFQTHAGVQSAVHRDLVNASKWHKELGTGYSFLLKTRMKADYGGGMHVLDEEAARALETASLILKTVHETRPDIFPLDALAEDTKSR